LLAPWPELKIIPVVVGVTMRLTLAATAVGTLLSLLTAAGHAQIVPPVSEVKVTVVDQIGALIDDCEVVFKSDSERIVAHPGQDRWWIRVRLPSGQYAVTASKAGFLKNEVPDFQVVAPEAKELKIVLNVDPDVCRNNACVCGPGCGAGAVMVVPTTPPEPPRVIQAEPAPAPPVQPAARARKSRSLRCLYLWKCSTS
jgi:hypothetical protein